ncbi:MAG: hypothetical protein ACODAA_09530 [Gemmatimonadota bacterium]
MELMKRRRFAPILFTLAVLLPLGSSARHLDSGEARDAGSHCSRAEHREFDFWVGEWEVHNRQANPAIPDDTTLYDTGTATAEVHPILDGCGIVEHWGGRLVPDRHVLGFSLRAWNPDTERWHVLLNWPGPGAPTFFEIDGTFDGDVGDFVFRGRGGFVRYRFTGTRGGEPRWEGARADERDGPWTPFWVMRFTPREEPGGGILPHGRSRTTDRCPDDAFRGYDFLIGDWTGEEVSYDGEGEVERTHPISIRSWSILEGCAIVDHVVAGGAEREETGETKRFFVRSFEPAEDGWVQYSLSRDELRLVRWEGDAPGEGAAALVRAVDEDSGTDGPIRRMTWRRDGDRLIRETAVSPDGGESWTTSARAEMRRE